MGDAYSFFDSRTYTTSTGSNAGASANLGSIAGALGVGGAVGTLANGITVGGSNYGGSIVSESQDRVAVIVNIGRYRADHARTIGIVSLTLIYSSFILNIIS